jgi:hypothetical protein
MAAAGLGAGRPWQRPGARSRRLIRPGSRLGWRRIASVGAVAAGLAVTFAVLVFPGGRQTGSVPAAVAAVARYAEAIPPPAREWLPRPGGQTTPVEVGRPVTVTAGGQRIVMRTWRLDGTEAVVAVSGLAFPMPPGAVGTSGGGMAWSARLGKLGLYCLNGPTSELVAAPVPAAELAVLIAQLPLT